MKEILNKYSDRIKSYFDLLLDEKAEYFNTINKWGYDVIEKLKIFSKNGKLIRGSIVLFTQELFGGKIDHESVKVAVAIELFHSGLLIHDDIIDRDKLRRGNPSVYHQYAEIGIDEKIVDPQQFGLSMGICAGDMGFFIGFELLSDLKINNASKEKMMRVFTSEFSSVGLGQMQDIYFGQSSNEPREEDVFKLYIYKTARYTFSLPFLLGGLLAGVPDEELKNLEKLGEYLGLIFQIKDDELGIFSKKGDFGKPIGSDISENKKTLYYLYLFRYANEEEKKYLRSIFGSPDISDDSIKYVHKIINKYNIRNIIDNKINEYKNNCEELIFKMRIDNNNKSRLNQIVEYNLNRTK